jgi:hypothetical protein
MMNKSEIVKQAEQVIQDDKPKFDILQKLESLFNEILKDADVIPAILRPTVVNLVKGYLVKADPKQVRAIVQRIKDEVLPWLLE